MITSHSPQSNEEEMVNPTVMPDLVERLRGIAARLRRQKGEPLKLAALHEEAADEITRLRAEREKMGIEAAPRSTDSPCATDAAAQSARREALEQAANLCEGYRRDASFDDSQVGSREHRANQWNIAQAIRSLAVPQVYEGECPEPSTFAAGPKGSPTRHSVSRRGGPSPSSIEAGGGGSDVSGEQTAVPCAANIVAQSKLKALLREMSDVLLTLRPMGGSEMLKRVYIDGQEEYYADAHYCARLIEQMRADWREVRIPRATTKSIEPQVPVAHVDEVCEPGTVKPPPPQDGVTELPSEETLAMIEKLDFEIAELDGQIIELRNRDQTPVEAAILVLAKRTRELLSEAHAILTATPGLINHSAMRR